MEEKNKDDNLKIKVWRNYEPKTQEEILSDKVNDKLVDEYNNYIDYLRTLSVDEIIEKAYETTCKREIVDSFDNKFFDEKESKALLKENNLLHQFYDEWLAYDSNFTEMFEDPIDETIELSVEDYEKTLKKNKTKEK